MSYCNADILSIFEIKTFSLKKIASIFLLSLLICNVLSFTFVMIWNEWEAHHSYHSNAFVEVQDEILVLKVPISIPYQNEWTETVAIEKLAIFEGDFYKSFKQSYQKDTLYTYYQKQPLNRENMLSLLRQLGDNLDNLSDQHKDSSKKTHNFLKNISKDYMEFQTKTIHFFWIEELGIKNYKYSLAYHQPILKLSSPPPSSLC